MKAIRLIRLAIIAGASMVASVLCADSVPEGFGSDVTTFLSFAGFENGMTWSAPAASQSSSWYTIRDIDLTGSSYGENITKMLIRTKMDSSVSVTNEVPGPYLYATAHATEPMVANYQSMRVYANSATYGAHVSINVSDLSAAVAETGEFTIEMFVKPEADCAGTPLWGYFGTADSAKNTNLL